MATIKLETNVTITDVSGAKLPFASTKSITYTTKEDREYAITAATEQVIFDPSTDTSEAISNFTFLYIIASAPTELEIECDTGADVGREQLVVSLVADVPFILGDNASRAGVVAFDGFGGTVDVIDKIVAKAASGADVNLRLIVAG